MGTLPLSPPLSGLADALFTTVQQRVLGLLFGQPDRQFQGAEVIRIAQSGTGAVHRQLQRLADAGLVSVTAVGNHRYYQANRKSPVFKEVHGLVLKTVGLREPIRRALAPIVKRIRAAFIYGSVGAGTDKGRSDVDLMVIADRVDHADLFDLLHPVERELSRTVNPTVMTTAAWRTKRVQPGSFVARMMQGPRLMLVGTDDDLD